MTALLSISELRIQHRRGGTVTPLVDGVSFTVAAGEALGLVGESGSGKTLTALSALRLLPPGVVQTAGSIVFAGRELSTLDDEGMRRLRGNELAMIFQDPMTSLNPAFTIGNQIAEAVRAHRPGTDRATARNRAVEMLDLVGIPAARARLRDYPHAFSGGMRQRAMIAMALSGEPRLLIADEPTTALDVTIQAQILELLARLQQDLGMAMIVVTHDLGVVADVCHRVCVMYAGQLVERAPVDTFYARPRHPYGEGLLRAMPQSTAPGARLRVIPGAVPSGAFPPGCRFHPRCGYVEPACTADPPDLVDDGPVSVRCRRHAELRLRGAR